MYRCGKLGHIFFAKLYGKSNNDNTEKREKGVKMFDHTSVDPAEPERGSTALEGLAAAAAANIDSGSIPSKALDRGSTAEAGLGFPFSLPLPSRTIFFTSDTLQAKNKVIFEDVVMSITFIL